MDFSAPDQAHKSFFLITETQAPVNTWSRKLECGLGGKNKTLQENVMSDSDHKASSCARDTQTEQAVLNLPCGLVFTQRL